MSVSSADLDKYKRYRNTLNRIKLHEKRVFYKDVMDKIGKNSKMLWDVVNHLVKKTNNKCEITELLINGQIVNSQAEISDAFNVHFSEAGVRVQDSIPATNQADPCKLVKPVTSKMSFKRVTEGQICNIVSKLKNKKSCGLDGISNVLLKKLVNVIRSPLCTLFNMSLSTGVFPDMMKIAKVIPLHKGGAKDLTDNYRPISLLPVISKVLEKVVYSCTVTHMEENDVIYARQYSFRKKHNTTDAVMNFVAEVLNAFSENRMVIAIFVDLRLLTVCHTKQSLRN